MALIRTYEAQECRIASALEVVGQRWTLLIVREALRGPRRFTDFKTQLGVAPNILHSRLEFLIEMQILERRDSRERPHHVQYELTRKGRDLWPVLAALGQWSETHLKCDDWPPFALVHESCGGPVKTTHHCGACDAELGGLHAEVAARRGPTGPRHRKP